MLIHVDQLDSTKFLHIKIDHERGRRYFAMADPLVLIRLDGDIELRQGNYYDASVGWDRGDAEFVCGENVGRQHTKITLRKSYGPTPPASFDPGEFKMLSQIIADAPRAVAAKFDSSAIAEEVIGQLRNHVTRLGLRVWVGGVLTQTHDDSWCDLKVEIEELCRIANGAVDRESAAREFIEETHELVQDIAELCGPYYTNEYTIPDEWRKTRLGQAWDAVRYWLLSEDMITLSDAARMLYDAADAAELNKLDRLITRGDLDQYNDPSEGNPRKARRVLKRQVRALLKKRDR